MKINRDTVRSYIEELVIVKTMAGLKFQSAILKKVSEHVHKPFRLANPEEESKGIDGYIGEMAVSVKPITYKIKAHNESIEVPIIYYDKKKDGIVIEFDL